MKVNEKNAENAEKIESVRAAETAGYKSRFAVFAYCFPAVGVAFFVAVYYAVFFKMIVDVGQKVSAVIAALVISAVCVYAVIFALSAIISPKKLIAATESEVTLLGKNKTILFKDIRLITCKLSKARSSQNRVSPNRSGRIIITTKSGKKYVQRFLDSARDLNERLNALWKADNKKQEKLKQAAEKYNPQNDIFIDSDLQKYKYDITMENDEYILMNIKPKRSTYIRHAWLALGDDGVFANTPMSLFLFGLIMGSMFIAIDTFANFITGRIFFYGGVSLLAVSIPVSIIWASFNASRYKKCEYLITNYDILEIRTPKNIIDVNGVKTRNHSGEFGKKDVKYRPYLGDFKDVEIYQNWFAKTSGTYCIKLKGNLASILIRYITEQEAEQIAQIHNLRGKKLASILAKSYKALYKKENPAADD